MPRHDTGHKFAGTHGVSCVMMVRDMRRSVPSHFKRGAKGGSTTETAAARTAALK